MPKFLLALLASAGALVGASGLAQAQPAQGAFAAFDVRAVQGWAEKLVLCDTTAFLATQPDLNANRMWVRRDDGHSDLLLPPDFVAGPNWYKEGYERLYLRLQRKGEIDQGQLAQAQGTLGHAFVEAYRRAGRTDRAFLESQDRYCRAMARDEGEIIS